MKIGSFRIPNKPGIYPIDVPASFVFLHSGLVPMSKEQILTMPELSAVAAGTRLLTPMGYYAFDPEDAGNEKKIIVVIRGTIVDLPNFPPQLATLVHSSVTPINDTHVAVVTVLMWAYDDVAHLITIQPEKDDDKKPD